LTCARELFARNGIHKTSIRAVAAAAGVDPALVHYYFGTKQQLFIAAVQFPLDPMTVISPIRDTPIDELGGRLASVLLPLWACPAGAGFIAILRSLPVDSAFDLLRSFVRELVVAELAARVDDPIGTGILRAEFVASQLVGVAITRSVVGLEPLASLPVETVVATISPNLQHYITGELAPVGE
jgi:AcrR family transcriptional regulator